MSPRRPCRRRRRSATALVIAMLWASTSPALAVSDEEIFRDFPFNLINPGARALGLGGAFISLADDSSAAQANPAGLTTLRRPELFAEVRSRTFDRNTVATSATLTGAFFQGELAAGAASKPESTLSPSFVSYVLPLERVSLGFSRLESLNVRTRTTNSFTIEGTEAILAVDSVSGDPVIVGFQPVDFELAADADADALIVQYNFALAFELHRTLSVGLTGVLGQAEIDGRVDNLFRDRTGGMFPVFTLDYATRIDDSDTDFAYNVGLLWRPAEWVSVGAVYREGLRFVLEERVLAAGARGAEAQEIFGASFANVLHTPDSYGLGLSFRPADPWTVLVDVVRVESSNLLDDYVTGLNRITFPETRLDFTVEDGDEYHVGVERIVLAGETPLAIRLGGWSQPDSRIRAAETTELTAAFPAGERLTHYTVGFGATLRQAIQIDMAADVSSAGSTVVFSTIYRF